MNQIFQNVEVAYSAITIQDAIVMLPVVDLLVEEYTAACRQLEEFTERKNAGEKVYEKDGERYQYRVFQRWEQLGILRKLGFACSNPSLVVSPYPAES